MPIVTALQIYPIKSCAGVALENVTLTSAGFVGDRDFMLATPDGKMLSQRSHPQMALIHPEPIDKGLRVGHEGQNSFELVVDRNGHDTYVNLFRENLSLVDQGDEAADWFTTALGSACRLVWSRTDLQRTGAVGEGPIGTGNIGMLVTRQFYDVGPVLLCNRATLDDFNERHEEEPFGMDRFRPNIVIEGAAAGDELGWPGLKGRDVALRNLLPCERCELPNANPKTGRADCDVYGTLRRNVTRLEDRYSAGYPFGAYMGASETGDLAVGEKMEILQTQ